jgi:hypothetical protein
VPAAFFDDDVGIVCAATDGQIAISVDAVLVTHRSDAISTADPLGAGRK